VLREVAEHRISEKEAIGQLGGAVSALERLRYYLEQAKATNTERAYANALLRHCGLDALETLSKGVECGDAHAASAAIVSLTALGPEAVAFASKVRPHLKHNRLFVRVAAACYFTKNKMWNADVASALDAAMDEPGYLGRLQEAFNAAGQRGFALLRMNLRSDEQVRRKKALRLVAGMGRVAEPLISDVAPLAAGGDFGQKLLVLDALESIGYSQPTCSRRPPSTLQRKTQHDIHKGLW
jgi:hypothetical protein